MQKPVGNQNPEGRPSLGDGKKQVAPPRGEGLDWCVGQANVFAPAMLVSSDPLILDGCPFQGDVSAMGAPVCLA